LFLSPHFLEVATVVGVAEVTIKNAYKDLYERRQQLVPNNFPVNPKSSDKKDKGTENWVDLYKQLPEP